MRRRKVRNERRRMRGSRRMRRRKVRNGRRRMRGSRRMRRRETGEEELKLGDLEGEAVEE